jgi:phosphoribosylformylglycinamidine cyclo-ligase
MAPVTESTYARVGVDTDRAQRATAGLVEALSHISARRLRNAVLPSGHYANVIPVAPNLGIALSTDGVGSKAIVAEQLQRFDTIGIDCVAMNVNDVICVGAEPIAMLDYLSVQSADPEMLRAIGVGLAEGAERARIDIPGGEVAQLPEMLRSHGRVEGQAFDLVGACFGTVALDGLVTGSAVEPGDVVIGLPSNGVHSNGLTLARQAFPDLSERPEQLEASAGEELLKPTHIYVSAALELIRSGLDLRGLAHVTSDGFRNLLRLEAPVGYRIDQPLPIPPVFDLIAERTGAPEAEMWDVFNMGCGFCCVVSPADADSALALLRDSYPGAAVVGAATSDAGKVEIPDRGLAGTREQRFQVS